MQKLKICNIPESVSVTLVAHISCWRLILDSQCLGKVDSVGGQGKECDKKWRKRKRPSTKVTRSKRHSAFREGYFYAMFLHSDFKLGSRGQGRLSESSNDQDL